MEVERRGDVTTAYVIFLASEVSNFVNGHILYIDGELLAYLGKQP